MPPEYRDPTDPAEWLRRARSNLARARADRHLPDVLYEDLCFDAQQAVEKALKALVVHRKVAFPFERPFDPPRKSTLTLRKSVRPSSPDCLSPVATTPCTLGVAWFTSGRMRNVFRLSHPRS
jgi:hypothetical protein